MITEGMAKLIKLAKSKNATDIHVCVGSPIMFRVGNDLIPSTAGKVTPELAERVAFEMLKPEQIAQFHAAKDYDCMIGDEHGRYRVNISLNDGMVGAVIRILPDKPYSIDQLRLPPVIKTFAEMTKGLVLITGSTSQGKSATMSGIIHELNMTRRRHIVTIEDPIETVHENKMSIVRQREVGRDTQSFYMGLRAALRQDPDVIAIGEMRDYETIKIALTAAETGVLVLSTLHIISIDKLIERLLSYAPSEDQNHLRLMLASAIQVVVHQELLPATDGGKRVACEIMMATAAVKNVIRVRDSFMLRNIIHTGLRYGMVTMRSSVESLVADGSIDQELADAVMENY